MKNTNPEEYFGKGWPPTRPYLSSMRIIQAVAKERETSSRKCKLINKLAERRKTERLGRLKTDERSLIFNGGFARSLSRRDFSLRGNIGQVVTMLMLITDGRELSKYARDGVSPARRRPNRCLVSNGQVRYASPAISIAANRTTNFGHVRNECPHTN